MMEENKKEYEKAIAYIRSLIIKRKITIGSRIPSERKIAETLSISRNSTREALKRLENMGLIDSQQGRGNYLSGNITQSFSNAIEMMLILHQTDAADICQFRRCIEKTVYDLAYKKREENKYLFKMAKLLELFPTADLERQIKIDEEIHYLLVRATRNTLLIAMMDSISAVYRQWVGTVLRHASPDIMKQLHNAHITIYKSLMRGNPEEGIQAIDQHYDIIDHMSLTIHA
ncbi:GntR family transcriptional regulator [Megasphaera paucivorans]|nr:GntR family transcriptional regulator [Megasphaera paucivorans]